MDKRLCLILALALAFSVTSGIGFAQGESRQLTVNVRGTGAIWSTPAGINGCLSSTSPCRFSFSFGSLVSLVAAGGRVPSWSGACANTSGCAVVMDSNKEVTATFSDGEGSDPRATPPSLSVIEGSTATSTISEGTAPYSILTQPESARASASISGSALTVRGIYAGSTSVVVRDSSSQPRTILIPITVTTGPVLIITVTGSGTVTSGTAISCTSSSLSCSYQMLSGSSNTLTAAPSSGGTFTGWGGACSSRGTQNTCELTMDANKDVTATFSGGGTGPRLTITVTGSGTVSATTPSISCTSASSLCNYNPGSGTSVTLTASGGTLQSWGGACSGASSTCTVTMSADKQVTATFSGAPPPCNFGSHLEGFDAAKFPTQQTPKYKAARVFACYTTPQLTDAVISQLRDAGLNPSRISSDVINFDVEYEAGKKVGKVDVIRAVGSSGVGAAWQWLTEAEWGSNNNNAGNCVTAPNRIDIVRKVNSENSGLINNCNAFTEKVACELWNIDKNFGRNGKRGNTNDPSEDAIAYYGTNGPGGVDVIDIIGSCGGANPTPQWLDQTQRYAGGALGAWVAPACAPSGSRPSNTIPAGGCTPQPGGTPSISSLSPSATIARGERLTITGTSLTNVVQFFDAGNNRHTAVGNVNAGKTQTTVTVPTDLPDGTTRVRVYAAANRISNEKAITVSGGTSGGDPVITSITPTSAAAGQMITITGTSLTNIVRFYGTGTFRQTEVGSVIPARTQTTITVPSTLAAGIYTVKIYSAGRESNGVQITVTGGTTQGPEIITQNIGDGVFPDVAWFNNDLYVAYYTTADRKVIVKKLSKTLQTPATLEIESSGAGGAFPRLGVYNNNLYIIYRKDDGSVIYRTITTIGAAYLSAGTAVTLPGSGFGNNPVAIGNGYVAWQTSPTTAKRLSLTPGSSAQDITILQSSTGINRIMPDGSLRLIEDERLAVSFGTNAWYADDLTVAEAPSGGVAATSRGDQFMIWGGEETFTPHAAASASKYAVATWGRQGMRVALITRQAGGGTCELKFASNIRGPCFRIFKTDESESYSSCSISDGATERRNVHAGRWDMRLDFSSVPSGYAYTSVNPAGPQDCNAGESKLWTWTFTGPNATNITNATSPHLSVSKSSFMFTATAGSNLSDTFTVTNTGGGLLSWNAQKTGSVNWLTLSRSSGVEGAGASSAPPVVVSVNTGGLAVGNYTANITVTSNAGNATIPVVLTITNGTGAGGLTVNPSSLSVQAGAAVTSAISDGTTPYSILTQPDSAKATAAISGTTLTVTGVAAGSTSVVVKDNASTPRTVTVPITVTVPPAADTHADFLTYKTDGTWAMMFGKAGDEFDKKSGSWDTNREIYPAKLNADSLTDFLIYERSTRSVKKAITTAANDFAVTSAGTLPSQPGQKIVVADLNGDGTSDIFAYSNDNNNVKGYRCISGAALSCGSEIQFGDNRVVNAAKLNSDNSDDLLFYGRMSGNWQAARSTSTGFDITSGAWGAGYDIAPADFSGDGLTDFFLYKQDTGAWMLATTASSASGISFTTAQGTIAAGFKPYVAEFNDGKADVFLYNPTTGAWAEFINTGSGLPSSGPIRSGTWEAGLELHVTDLDGDGKTDMIAYRPSNGDGSIKRSTGIGAFAEKNVNMDSGVMIFTSMPSAGTLGWVPIQLGSFSPTQLVANPASISVTTGATRTSALSGGATPYSKQTEPNSAIATAALSGSTLTVTGVAGGSTSVVLRDSTATPLTITIPITVSNAAANRFVVPSDVSGFAFAGSGLTRQEIGDAPANIYAARYEGLSSVFAYVIEFNARSAAVSGRNWLNTKITEGGRFTAETRTIDGNDVAVYSGTGQSIIMWTYNNFVIIVMNLGTSATPDDVIRAYLEKYSNDLSGQLAVPDVTAADLQEVSNRLTTLKNRFADLQLRAVALASYYANSDASLSSRYTNVASMFGQAKTMSERIIARISAAGANAQLVTAVRSDVNELRNFLRQVLLASLNIESSLSGGGLFGS